jgi:hypothetical protein
MPEMARRPGSCIELKRYRTDAGRFKALPAVPERSDFNDRHREHLLRLP